MPARDEIANRAVRLPDSTTPLQLRLTKMTYWQDVARVALFLASELSSYVNGANIVVDGGRTTISQECYED